MVVSTHSIKSNPPLLHSQLTLTLLSLHIKNYNQNYHETNHGYARNSWFVANHASVTSPNNVKLTSII